MPLPELAPITDADLEEYCQFLHVNLDPATDAARFKVAFEQRWGMDKPNHGFLIRDNGILVGGIGAIYALRELHGRPERFCNITSWCVLERYRGQSMRLALALVAQKGFHFTDLTPTEVVEKSLLFLKFKPMDGSRTVIFNLPVAIPGIRILSGERALVRTLAPETAQVYEDHKRFPWLYHLAIGKKSAYCYIIYKRRYLKGLPCAEIIAVSDGALFHRYCLSFGGYVLVRHGMATTRVESRLLPKRPAVSKVIRGYRFKMFKSDTLGESDIDNLYSELVALDL